MVCTTRTPNIGPIAQRAIGPIAKGYLVWTTLSAASTGLISILWKPMVCTTRTPNIGYYLVHGPCFPRYTCLDIWKCTKFKRLSHYLIRCVHRADFHFMEAYGLYYSYTQYWTHSSKGYLVHGPCFPRYTCLDIRKCTKFKRLSHYLIRCVHRADFHFMEAYGLYYLYTLGTMHFRAIASRTPNIGPIAQRATWYMDHASHDTLV